MFQRKPIFYGGKRVRETSGIGGSRNAMVKLGGISNDLIFPPMGGIIKNPFKGSAKFFCGDLMEYRTTEDGTSNAEVYILKTFKVQSATGTTVNIYRDGFLHIPFVGDILMKAPETITGTGAGYAVTAVEKTVVGTIPVWKLTLATTLGTLKDGDVLVEAAASGASVKMLVQNINACAPTDGEFVGTDASGVGIGAGSDFDSSVYTYAPALGGLFYTQKMSPIPPCVEALNPCKIKGWFRVDYCNMKDPVAQSTQTGS